MKVNADHACAVILKQLGHRGFELFRIDIIGDIFGGAFAIVLDAHSIEELDQDTLMGFHEPELDHVLGDFIGGFKLHIFHEPFDLGRGRLSLNENRTEFPIRRKSRERHGVDLPLLIAEVLKNGSGSVGIDFLENLVGFHDGGFFKITELRSAKQECASKVSSCNAYSIIAMSSESGG